MLPSRIEEVTHLIPAKVTVDMDESLIKEFTAEEIQTTLLQMHPTKASGPDGMSTIFYQKYGILLVMMLLIWFLMCLIPMLHLLK